MKVSYNSTTGLILVNQTKILKQIQSAVVFHNQGELDRADEIYREVLAEDPDNFYALRFLGCLQSARGLSQSAIMLLEKATSILPNDSECWFNLGNAYKGASQFEQAIISYRSAEDYGSINPQVFNNWGRCLQELSKQNESIPILEKAVAIDSNCFGAWFALGNSWRDLGQSSRAVICYKRAIESSPTFVSAHLNLAILLDTEGRIEDSITSYRKVIDLKPDFADPYFALALLMDKIGEVGEAIKYFKQLIKIKPDFPNAKKALMQCQGQNGLRDQISVEDYREQMEGNDEAGILIAAYPSFEMIPSNRRSVNSWVEDKNKFYFAGQMFGRVFVDLPWVKASSYATSSRLQIPDVGDEYLDAVDFYLSKIKTLQIRMSQAPIISSLVEYVARKKGSSIDVIDIGGWSGNALFLAGFNDSWDVVKTWEVIETAAVCSPARDQLPGMLDSLPDDSAGKRNLVKLSFTELESFYGESSDSQNVDLIWSSTAQHYNAFFPRDLDALLSRGAQVVYFDTLPYLCSSNPSLNICELSELGVNDQNVYFLISQQYLSSLISEASQKHGYSYKLWSQSVEPRLVFWQPQEGDKVLPKKVIDGAKPLLMKVCSIRFDKLD